MQFEDVKREVRDLTNRLRWERDADAFPVWYLRRRFPQLPDAAAQRQSADPAVLGAGRNNDHGIDAYHIAQKEDAPFLLIVQAKYSEAPPQVRSGFKDLTRSVETVAAALNPDGEGGGGVNKVLANLRADLAVLPEDLRRRLLVEWTVLHLNTDDREDRKRRMAAGREELQEQLQTVFGEDRLSVIQDVGPAEIVNVWVDPPPPPPDPWHTLSMAHIEVLASHDGADQEMLFGVGRLSELVEMYAERRQGLFQKNVRSFLDTKKNRSHGPSGEIRRTLRAMCVDGKQDPSLFAFLHNGVTLCARAKRATPGGIEVQAPYVLNGCQTITTAYRFSTDATVQKKLKDDRWQEVRIPIRVVVTKDEDFIRDVTISNNRQNEMKAAALHANDPVQLTLQGRFRDAKIYYERQLGAFDAMPDAEKQAAFPNGQGNYVEMVSLARCIAAASGHLEDAHHPDDLFQNPTSYERCFHDDHLHSITLLTFLQNLHDVIPVVLTGKDELNLEYDGTGPRPKRLLFYALNLFVRYLAKQNDRAFVSEWGGSCGGGTRSSGTPSGLQWAMAPIARRSRLP